MTRTGVEHAIPRRGVFCLAMLVLAACGREPAPVPATMPAVSVTIPASSGAASEVEVAPSKSSVAAPPAILVGRAVVDVAGRSVVRTLTEDAFGAGATYGSTAYLCVGRWSGPSRDERLQELRAYNLATGKLRCSKPVAYCRSIAAGAAGVLLGRYSGGAQGATFYDGAKGTPREVAPGPAVVAVHPFGTGFVALHENGVLDALDGESLAVRGTVKLPFVPGPFELGASFVERDALAGSSPRRARGARAASCSISPPARSPRGSTPRWLRRCATKPASSIGSSSRGRPRSSSIAAAACNGPRPSPWEKPRAL
ncbi:hypothetical protein [Polyangium mundeleinium]|uniref:Lipoprotein n=1 Tax=Polyangium mundeleinium TaxID=2995306 RepID=A0ABT5EU14_9BACT|nr:hypothetical protein [Polyangium mundeleinium]MDC0745320.1 hypothetical protein [Polyangium mundeleinium]